MSPVNALPPREPGEHTRTVARMLYLMLIRLERRLHRAWQRIDRASP